MNQAIIDELKRLEKDPEWITAGCFFAIDRILMAVHDIKRGNGHHYSIGLTKQKELVLLNHYAGLAI